MNTKHTDSVEATIEAFFSKQDEFGYSVDTAASGGDLNNKEAVRDLLEPKLLELITTLQATQSQQVEEAVRKERERCIKVVEDYGKSMSELHSDMIANAHEDSKMMLAYDMHSRLIAVRHIINKLTPNHQD